MTGGARAALMRFAGAILVLAACGATEEPAPPAPTSTTTAASSTSATVPAAEVPRRGTGTWRFATPGVDARSIGSGPEVLRYNVAVEGGVAAEPEEVARFVASTLADPRGWVASGRWTFAPVGEGPAEVTFHLATPDTRAEMCNDDDAYTSCRIEGQVVINLERWVLGVPHWSGPLEDYRRYIVNHELGHRLGEGHVACADPGTPAPVMAQQTLSLDGCLPNPWPYVDGTLVTGPPL